MPKIEFVHLINMVPKVSFARKLFSTLVEFARNCKIIALCGYPLVKMELEIQTRFLPRLPFSCNSIISDKIWWKMSLSLSIFFSFASNFPCKILWDNKNIDANIFIFQIPFSQCWGPRRKKLFWGFFLSIKKSACVPNLKFLRHPQQVLCQ